MSGLIPSSESFFVNPYNFVSQSIAVDRRSREFSDIVSGYISCRIIVKDKLAMPDYEGVKEKNVKGHKYDFYSVGNTPIIPGSEIRGCIRNIYETLTGSCYSIINSNTLTKRVSVSWGDIASPCIVKYENENWYIYPAKKLSKEDRQQNGKTGLMRRWKAAPNVRLEFITQFYEIADNSEKILCDKSKMEGFSDIIDIYLKNNINDHEFIKCIEILKGAVNSKQPFVAFYKCVNGVITYFSPAQLGGRTAYKHKVSDFLGEYAPCSGKNGYCPACSLFGAIGKNLSVASKIRFSDAVPKNEFELDDYITLPPLSSPKTTSVEFYSQRGNKFKDVARWDYDSDGVMLNGRKYYLHSKPKIAQKGQELVTGQFSTRTVPANSEFEFKVYFDNISKNEQLSKLLWCLSLGDSSDKSNLLQKIGAGKSVGYGSIKIIVDTICIRRAENGNYAVCWPSYTDLVATESMFDPKALKMLKLVSDYNYVLNENVSYPIADNGKCNKNSKSAHQWFSSNRPTKPAVFKYVLPAVAENGSELKLPAMLFDMQQNVLDRKNSVVKNNYQSFDESKFTVGEQYTAEFISKYNSKNGVEYANIVVKGVKVSVKASYLPIHIKKGNNILVRYDGLKGKFPKFFIKK